ncbi:unnamed protein product [Protopolystoma xenopodis]|uniref:Uncharacterized protein n=1 Tax=Protopolystoma xenopodis TaxID=117903 RepID=A0A3S5FGM0_9PLAT|nr:unnamed protein product [Protopolystoma xenopodis]
MLDIEPCTPWSYRKIVRNEIGSLFCCSPACCSSCQPPGHVHLNGREGESIEGPRRESDLSSERLGGRSTGSQDFAEYGKHHLYWSPADVSSKSMEERIVKEFLQPCWIGPVTAAAILTFLHSKGFRRCTRLPRDMRPKRESSEVAAFREF